MFESMSSYPIDSRRTLEAGLSPGAGGLVDFLCGFLVYAFSAHGGFLFIDSANLVVHEGGHNLFGWFGSTIGLWGGTLLQWLVPFLLAAYFFTQRQTTGFVFCLFFFFENWLYTATYMADARAQVLPLVTTGESDFVEHDFYAIFSSLGVLNHDTQIAAVVRLLGWCGMIAVGCVAGESNGRQPRERQICYFGQNPESRKNLKPQSSLRATAKNAKKIIYFRK